MKQAAFQQAISVVIPMYNEADNVAPLLHEVAAVLPRFATAEIVVVDDCSRDQTRENLLQLMPSMPQLRVISHRHNYGQSAGVVSGVRAARHEWIATLDGDGQNDPADIPQLFAELNKHLNATESLLLIGNRKQRNDNWLRRLSSRLANQVRASLLQDECPDSGCGLKVFQREVFLQLPHFKHLHRFLPALYKRAGGTIINVPVNHRPRTRGVSKYGVMNRLWVGIVDLVGVAWLIRRPCNPEVSDGIN